MKKTNNKIESLPLLLAACTLLLVTGCEKDTGWITGPDTKYPYISNTIHGITYEYYLLDKNGDKSVVFDEGDTITFCLYITNNNKDTAPIIKDIGVYYNDTGIFSVYSSKGELVGGPECPVATAGKYFMFDPGFSYGREYKWPGDYRYVYCDDKDFLPPGDYYTTFTKAFDFTGLEDSDSSYNTDPLTFWIDFRVR